MERAPTAGESYAITHPLRPQIAASLVTLLFFTLTCCLIYTGLRHDEPAQNRWVITYIVAFIALWIAATLIMAIRRPSAQERVILWRWIANAIIIGSNLACLGVIWAVMPHASPSAQTMCALFLVGCNPIQIICSPENVTANRAGVAAMLGSLAIFLATRPEPLAHLAAIYVFGYACMLIFLSNALNGTVAETVAARLASDASARQLNEMLGEVAAQRDANTKFIASVSHDLGQPLQAVALFFDQSVRAPNGVLRNSAIDGVRNGLAAADQLLSQMLAHLRLAADAVKPHPSQIVLPPFLERVAAQNRPAAALKGMHLRVAAHAHALLLDHTLIERAISNLVHNALTHSHGSRVLLAARRHGPAAIRLWVIDDGVGVSRLDAGHIFEDYYQGSSTPGAVPAGFGLGLASVRRLAALMGGVAGLDPRWRRGAAFYLEFPAAFDDHPATRTHPS